MSDQKKIRIAVIGVGNIGTLHLRCLRELPDFELAAICDIDESRRSCAPEVPFYADYQEMIAKENLDAVTVATPHWLHPPIGAYALNHGKHVLVEKPIGVHKKAVRELLDAIAAHPELKCAAMFCQRTIDAHKRIKHIIDSGELGKILRVNWIITDWFRTQSYYDSGDWRASWRGEGGGALINQCPHQLDLMQWFFGMPEKVTAFMKFGKYHKIEVEDDVTAFLQYPSGATGVFITSTGEAPGTNRLEITADRGRLVLENGKIEFIRNEIPVLEFCANDPGRFSMPPRWNCSIPVSGDGSQMHKKILENFGKAILHGEALTARAEEGIRGLELGNAMLLSHLENRTVTLPIDEDCLAGHFDRLIASSTYVKKTTQKSASPEDFSKSFNK